MAERPLPLITIFFLVPVVPVNPIVTVGIVTITIVASMVIPVPLDQVAGACAKSSTNQGTFPTAGQGANRRATGASNKSAFPGTNVVIGMPVPMPPIVLTIGDPAWRHR